jgi:hypothetical protein
MTHLNYGKFQTQIKNMNIFLTQVIYTKLPPNLQSNDSVKVSPDAFNLLSENIKNWIHS